MSQATSLKEKVVGAYPYLWFALPRGSKRPGASANGWCLPDFPLRSDVPPPDVNCAVPTGSRNGLLVLDVDNKKSDGRKSLIELEALHGSLPLTYTVQTPSGGFHYYFNWTLECEGTTVGVDLVPGVDWRGDKGYVVGAGSEVNGKIYEVLSAYLPVNPPAWLVEFIQEKQKVSHVR